MRLVVQVWNGLHEVMNDFSQFQINAQLQAKLQEEAKEDHYTFVKRISLKLGLN